MRIEDHTTRMRGATSGTIPSIFLTGKNLFRRSAFSLFLAPLLAAAGIADTSADTCPIDTTQANFQIGVPTGLTLTSGGDVTLASNAVIDQQNTNISVNGFAFTNSARFGQTFTAGQSGQLSRLDVYLFCSACTGTTPAVAVAIQKTGSDGLPDGVDLATTTIPGFNTGAGAYFSAYFSSPATLTAGTKYAFLVWATSNPSVGTYAYIVSLDDAYSAGARINSTSAGLYWDVRTQDTGFRAYVGSGYVAAGNLVSYWKDSNPPAGTNPVWTNLSWSGSTPASTALKFQVAGAAGTSGPWNFIGPDGTANSYFTSSGASLSQFSGNRYLKYKAVLSNTNTAVTPTLNDVTVCYSTAASSADVQITKTDGVTTATPGSSVTYTIVASNAGPSAANGATVTDTLPAELSCNWTCAGAGGASCPASGSGSINSSVNLPAGGSTTFIANCSIAPSAVGSLANTASISSPITDPVPANNSATDTDALAVSANLGITKSDGVTSAVSGSAVTYTIVASNAGPSPANGATVTDTLPAALSCNWTCAGTGGATCPASGSGSINSSVNLPAGGSTTFTANCTIAANATGSVSNTASVTSTVADPVPSNNSATDTDTLVLSSNLGITITDGVTVGTPGLPLTYTIVASNAGPNEVNGATVTDTFPGTLSCSWTCAGAGGASCPASGSGSINSSVNLPVGGTATFIANCSIAASATGSLSNTAAISSAASDPAPGNNSATDTDTLTPSANLGITKTNGVTTSTPGATTSYNIVASNAGPSNVPAATVTDTLPAALSCTWTCVGADGGSCPASGSGNISSSVSLPAGGSASFTASCTITANATGTLSNSASVASSVADPVPGNNSANDTDNLAGSANVGITNSNGVTVATPGSDVTYTIVASNIGPSAVTGATVADTFPSSLSCNWTCTASTGGSCPATGSGHISHAVNLPVAGSATFKANCTIAASAKGSVTNTATVSAPMTDPVMSNNSASDTDTLQADAIFVSDFESM